MKSHHQKMIETIVKASFMLLVIMILTSFLLYESNFKKGKKYDYWIHTQSLPEGDFNESFSKDEIVLKIDFAKNKYFGSAHFYGIRPIGMFINGQRLTPHDLWHILKEEPYFSAFQDTIKVVLKADQETMMGDVIDLKEELRKYNPTEIIFVQKNRSISKEQYFRKIEDSLVNIGIEPRRTAYPHKRYELFK